MTTGNNLSDFKALLDQKEHSVASDLKGLKTEIKQKVDTRKWFWGSRGYNDEKAFYSAGTEILGSREKSYQELLHKYGLSDIGKKLGMDTKVNVQNAKNVFERKAQEFQKKIENGKHNRNDEELALEVATKITEADKAAIKEIRQEYEQLLQKDEEAKKNIVDTQQTQKVKALDADGVFTKAANPLKIHQIVAMSNQADANKLVLDYSGSKSAKIKSKVQALTGGNNRILIEKKGNTFVYEGTNERALVYEGVQLLPATAELASRKGKEYVEQKTQATLANEKKYKGILNNFKAMGFDFQKEMQLRLPNGSPDGKKEMKIAGALYDLTEKVLEDLVIGALNGTSTPKNMEKPFEDVMRGGTVAEFISLSGQHNISVLTEKQLKEKLPDERLGEKLYDFLNEGSNEDKVVNYLNTRRKELYTEKVTKNQNFTMDAKKQGLKVENGKVKDKDGKEVALDDNQVFIEGLDVDRKDPKEAIWMQHQIEAEMERIVENIKNGKITMPENDQPFGTNALWTSHYIEFDQKNGVMDWEVFASNLFNGHKETEKIFDNDSNTKKVVNYMNKLWKEKYTDLVKEQKNIAEISKETDINKLSSSIDTYFTEIQTLLKKTYLNESEKAEVRIKKREISKALPLLEEWVQALPDTDPQKQGMQDTIRSYKKKLAEITSGTGGETTGVKDADALENILTKSDADENIEIAIQHLDAEIEGKPIDELIDLYVAKHQAIANNRSKIDAFKSSVPAYMHTLGEKIFDNIRNTPDTGETGNFPLEMKRGKLFELAQVARDESSRVNIDNHFIDYDLSEEIFQELATGKGGFMDKLDESKTIKPEHKESKDLSIEQRKTLLRSFPGGKVLVEGENGKSGADWITKDYKDLSINERGLLATYVNYQNRFGTIDQAKLTDTDYVELVSSQLNEMIQKTSAFMMDDYERKMDNRMKQLGYNDSRSPLIFQGLSGLDADIAKAYIDMKGFGYLNTSDRNTQKLKEYTAMAAVLVAAIVATVATAGAGGAALAGAIASVAGMASATAAMTTVSTVVVWALVGSAVMIGGEFVQGKAYETFNEWFVDTATMTATFVGVSLVTAGLWRYIQQLKGLSKIFSANANKLAKGLGNTTLSVGDGAFMGAVENQRQLWLTGESHPEMIFQMMGLAAGMGLIMRGFKPRNQRTSKPNNKPDSIAEKMLDKGEWAKLVEANKQIVEGLEKELPNVKDTKAKADLEALKARYEEYGKQLEAEMAKRSNAKSKPESWEKTWEEVGKKTNMKEEVKLSEEQIKERIKEIDLEIEELTRQWHWAPTQERIDNAKRKLEKLWKEELDAKGKARVTSIERSIKGIEERMQKIKVLQAEKAQLEWELIKLRASKNPDPKEEQKIENDINKKEQEIVALKEEVGTKFRQVRQDEIALLKEEKNVLESKVESEPTKNIPSKDYVIARENIENKLVDEFDAKLTSPEWITIDGYNYRMVYENTPSHNTAKKWEWKWIENGRTVRSAKSETEYIPENGNGTQIRERYYALRDKYVNQNMSEWQWQQPEVKQLWPAPEQKMLPPYLWPSEIAALPPHTVPKVYPKTQFPHRLLPIFLLPLDREKPSDIRYRIGQDIQTEIEGMIKNPTDGGILVPTNEVLPRDPKKIETVFQQLCKENGIEDPLNQNAFIMLRGVASRTYAGSGDAATYNKKLANERALAFKAYLQDKYGIPNDHFIADAFHKDTMVPDDYPENRQWVSMRVVNIAGYNTNDPSNLPTGTDDRVLSSASDTQMT